MDYWNQELASLIQLLLIITLFVLLIIKRKKLGHEIIYFISAGAIVMIVSLLLFVMRLSEPTFSISPVYNLAINFAVFFLFFIYLRKCLDSEISKRINLILFVIFVLSFILINIFFSSSYKNYPLLFYFIQVIILLGNIFLVLRQTFNSNKILKLKSYYPFWVCIGLMTNYVGLTPLLIISHTAMEIINMKIFYIILFLVNLIGYTILITGAILAENINKTSELNRD